MSRLDCSGHLPFFKRQHKIVSENCGKIDPERIEDYIAEGGYEAPLQRLENHDPRGSHRTGDSQRTAGSRWRGFSDRSEVDGGVQSGEQHQIRHLQRGRR